MLKFVDFSFYKIETEYLKFLHSIDSEVYYDISYEKNFKPYIDLLIGIENYKYFIPITSPKEKHKLWKNVSSEHFLIYEVVKENEKYSNHIYKAYSSNKLIHVLGVLDLKKMIPVPDGAYERIDFKCIGDNNYKNLLQKEYSFCLSVKEKIIKHVQKIYEKRNNNYKIRFSCDFNKLEKALEDWILNFKD